MLPSSQLPIDAEFELTDGSVRYRVLVGIDGERWHELAASKRWKAVYNYAVDGAESAWNWEEPIVGELDLTRRGEWALNRP